jgi:hypothetical protein
MNTRAEEEPLTHLLGSKKWIKSLLHSLSIEQLFQILMNVKVVPVRTEFVSTFTGDLVVCVQKDLMELCVRKVRINQMFKAML